MNDCHPTDELRAFMMRAQPIATQTPASGVQPRLRGFWRLVVAHRTGASADRADSAPRLRQPRCRTIVALAGIESLPHHTDNCPCVAQW
jgi:hypothetical protein